jgi:hypothetical protein
MGMKTSQPSLRDLIISEMNPAVNCRAIVGGSYRTGGVIANWGAAAVARWSFRIDATTFRVGGFLWMVTRGSLRPLSSDFGATSNPGLSDGTPLGFSAFTRFRRDPPAPRLRRGKQVGVAGRGELFSRLIGSVVDPAVKGVLPKSMPSSIRRTAPVSGAATFALQAVENW